MENTGRKGKVVAMANQKGGVSKTTTTVNLGIGLARAGKKVSLISAMSREYMLKEYIETAAPYYDYIIIDCLCG